MTPFVNEAVWALRPDFVALSIVVRGGRNETSDAGAAMQGRQIARPAWADDHLAAWRDAYRAFGAKPQRTPCSAEVGSLCGPTSQRWLGDPPRTADALWRRVERNGALTPINAVVDLYNAVSLR